MIYVNDKNQAEKWFDNSLGKQFNPDLFWISMLRLRKYVFMLATGERLQGLYAYNIPFDNKARIEKYGQIIKTMIAFTAKVGYCRFPVKVWWRSWAR